VDRTDQHSASEAHSELNELSFVIREQRVIENQAVRYQELPLGKERAKEFYEEALIELFTHKLNGEDWTFTKNTGAFLKDIFIENNFIKEVRESEIFEKAKIQFHRNNPDAYMFPLEDLRECIDLGYRWGMLVRIYSIDPSDSSNRLVSYTLSQDGASLLDRTIFEFSNPNQSPMSLSVTEIEEIEPDPLIPLESIVAVLREKKSLESYDLLEGFLEKLGNDFSDEVIENAFYLNIKILEDSGRITKQGSDGEWYYSAAENCELEKKETVKI
jgi:hypothetical protein